MTLLYMVKLEVNLSERAGSKSGQVTFDSILFGPIKKQIELALTSGGSSQIAL